MGVRKVVRRPLWARRLVGWTGWSGAGKRLAHTPERSCEGGGKWAGRGQAEPWRDQGEM